MNVLYEARHLYDEATDAVHRTTLTVEHHPGQLESLKAFLAGIAAQAGVYFAGIEHETVKLKTAAPVAEPPPAESLASEPEAAVTIEGEAHGEQPLQREHESEAAGDGPGPEGPEIGPPADDDEHAHGELAGTSGASAEAGSGTGNL